MSYLIEILLGTLLACALVWLAGFWAGGWILP